MTAGVIIGLVMEFTAIVLLAIGFLHEKKIIAIEDRIIRQFKRFLRRHLASWLNTPANSAADAKCFAPAPVICAAGVFEDLLSTGQLLEVKLDACTLASGHNIVA